MGINHCSVCHNVWSTIFYQENICTACKGLGYTIHSSSIMEDKKYGRLLTIEEIKTKIEVVKYVKVENSFRFFDPIYKHKEAICASLVDTGSIKCGGILMFIGGFVKILNPYSSTLNVNTTKKQEEEIAKIFGVELKT